MTKDLRQFGLNLVFINIFSTLEPVPYKIQIKFNEFQKNRIIQVLDAFNNSVPQDKNIKQEKTRSFYNVVITKIKNDQPLTCKEFQWLCEAILGGNIDTNNPTPNEENIFKLVSAAGAILFDLDKLSTDELKEWMEQENRKIIRQSIKEAIDYYRNTPKKSS